jgi:hypothetical protein
MPPECLGGVFHHAESDRKVAAKGVDKEASAVNSPNEYGKVHTIAINPLTRCQFRGRQGGQSVLGSHSFKCGHLRPMAVGG